MLFSVVTPSRNALDELRRCVGSVRGQQGVAVEHIVQDGASADGTAAWLREQAGVDGRSEPDDGMYDAINRGWARAHGDVLSWLNADEQYLPGALAAVAAVFRADHSLELLTADTVVVDDAGNALAARRETPLRTAFVRHHFLHTASCATFFRRSLREENRLRFDPRYRFAGDMDLILRLLETGVRTRHLRRFVALFGAAGRNLGALPEAREEARRVRARHGGGRAPLRAALIRLRRVGERALRGHYVPVSLEYDYALDDTPHYRHVAARRLPGRFDIHRHAHARSADS